MHCCCFPYVNQADTWRHEASLKMSRQRQKLTFIVTSGCAAAILPTCPAAGVMNGLRGARLFARPLVSTHPPTALTLPTASPTAPGRNPRAPAGAQADTHSMATERISLSGLARRLVDDGILSPEIASRASEEARKNRVPFVTHLVKSKLAQSAIAVSACEEFGVPLLNLDAFDPETIPKDLINEKLVRLHNAIPLLRRGLRLFVAVSDPTNLQGRQHDGTDGADDHVGARRPDRRPHHRHVPAHLPARRRGRRQALNTARRRTRPGVPASCRNVGARRASGG
ncbi:MAG: hypothetical protein EXR87_07820 [Gammaproteobacteria bacterium]|nr:hypothetical protein [Gammaproteobacteria bacterium]